MNRLTVARLFLPALLVLAPCWADAKPTWQTKAPHSKTVRSGHNRATNTYARSKAKQIRHRQLTRKQMKLYKKTGNIKHKQHAQKNAVHAGRAKVRMIKSQVKGLKAKAKLAIKSGNPDAANKYLEKAAKLEKSASSLSARLDKAEARFGSTAGRGKKASSSGAMADGPDTSQQMDNENPLTQKEKSQRVAGVASGKGKRAIKGQLEAGNLLGATETLRAMEAQPSRKGVMGVVDGYRKWSAKRKILKTASKAGKRAARQGDLQLAGEAAQTISTLRKPGYFTNRKINAIGNQALKNAKKMARTNRPEEARMMLDFARQIQAATGRQRPTLRFRLVRRTARKRAWKDMKARAKSGNLEGFRSAMRLASAYAKEDGRQMKKGDLTRVRKMYMTAVKNSVPRALRDAQMMLSGKMGYVNVEEAANRFAYAYDTASKLANRGIIIKTGLFSKSVGKQFSKTRKMLVTAMQNQSTMREVKRPGLLKRTFEKIFLSPQRRTQPTVAPMDGKWTQQQQQQQQQQMEMGGMEGFM